MNKLMKSYLDRVRSDPEAHIQARQPVEKLVGAYPVGGQVPIMYIDSYWPSFANSFLYGLEFDFLMLEALIIASMDRAMTLKNNQLKSGIALGAMLAYIVSTGFM